MSISYLQADAHVNIFSRNNNSDTCEDLPSARISLWRRSPNIGSLVLSLCIWSGIDCGLLRVHQYLTMVVWLTDSDTHPSNDGTDNDASNNASNDGSSYNPSGRTRGGLRGVVIVIVVVVVTVLSCAIVDITVVVIAVIATLRGNCHH